MILTVGAAWSADFEIDAHRSAARAVGLPADAVEAIIAGSRPVSLSRDADIAQRLTGSLLSDHRVPDQLYEDAVKAFSEDGIIAILSLIGQYQTILHTYVLPSASPRPPRFGTSAPQDHGPQRVSMTAIVTVAADPSVKNSSGAPAPDWPESLPGPGPIRCDGSGGPRSAGNRLDADVESVFAFATRCARGAGQPLW